MITITILDKDDRGRLSVDLRDILDALGDLARNVLWSVSASEALGAGAKALYAMQDASLLVTSEEFLTAARRLDQVIEGVFRGYAEGRVDAGPWIILAAVDSTSWDVSSDDERVLDRVRSRFRDVHEVGDVGYG